jgi:phage shock protein A
MTQSISVEDAFPTFQKQVRELFEEKLLLRAQVDVMERQLAEANAENASLKAAATESSSRITDLETQVEQLTAPPTAAPGAPAYGGPDLASQPPYPTGEQG